jgi:tetratricopeptide (TPR) repeat protein
VNSTPLTTPALIPRLTPDERRTAAEQYQIANQWLVAGQPEKAVRLLLNCCRLDPASITFRQALRRAQQQMPPARGIIGGVKKWMALQHLKKATKACYWLAVLQLAEDVLTLAPDNAQAHLTLAAAFEALGLSDHAVWVLEQAQCDAVAAELTRLYERTGKFSQARELAEHPDQHRPETVAASWQDRQQTELDAFRQDALLTEQKLASEPGNQELQTNLARLRHEIQARQIDICRQNADRHPDDLSCRIELGGLLLKAGQFEAALDALEFVGCHWQLAASARAAVPYTGGKPPVAPDLAWRALLYAAYCHLNLNQWRRAEPLFIEALSLMPTEAVATRQEVEALLAQHRLA